MNFNLKSSTTSTMLLLFGLVAASFVAAQQSTCYNSGVSDGSNCLCPPGFGGSTCDVPTCGGNIFQGVQRPLSQNSSTGGVSLSGCACESGWGGAGCNVCQSQSVCQSAFTAAGGSRGAQTASPLGASQVANQTLTCNTQSRVYAAQQMSCAVINPTLQGIFPLQSNLNILRTLDPTLTPSPNLTSFGPAGSAFAQLIYDGVEQFYCSASDCKQTVGNDTTEWVCSTLQCNCKRGTAFCGANSNMDLSAVLNSLSGSLTVSCTTSTATCSFKQSLLQNLFGSNGLALSNCIFGECVRQSVVDSAMGITSQALHKANQLSAGVIAGLAVVGVVALLIALLIVWGCVIQRRARNSGAAGEKVERRRVGVEWRGVGYVADPAANRASLLRFLTSGRKARAELGSTSVIELRDVENGEKPLPIAPSGPYSSKPKQILSGLSGQVRPGQMLAILGPSGAGKTTLISILAGRSRAMDGQVSGDVGFFVESGPPEAKVRVGFVDQTDVLPATLTVQEALLFAARLRMAEYVPESDKRARVETVIKQLGLQGVANSRIGGDGRHRGLSGGERRRVSIALEIVAGVEVLILDEPTSGLDSVSAGKVAQVLKDLAKDEENPVSVIASIHQPSSRLYHQFDSVLLLAQGQQVYFGPGGTAPVAALGGGMEEGYNVADFLLEVASDERVIRNSSSPRRSEIGTPRKSSGIGEAETELRMRSGRKSNSADGSGSGVSIGRSAKAGHTYAATFLTQVEVLCGREWKNLKRDMTLFFMHLAVASVLGLFTGGLYFHVKTTISGFQNRVGSLFFMGSLLAFSSLSALYNLVEVRPLFTRERAGGYYSPAAWLASRVLFDVLPLRIVPTIVMATITYWMVGLSPEVARFFKALLILVLFALAMTLFNFLLACVFRNGGVAILLSALFNLFTMTYAGFFVNLAQIPPVLRWLQYFSILKYCLEALSVNEVGSGLMIQDTLQGVPVNVSATLIMELLFGFGVGNYYRDVLVLFAWIAGLGAGCVGMVYWRLREVR